MLDTDLGLEADDCPLADATTLPVMQGSRTQLVFCFSDTQAWGRRLMHAALPKLSSTCVSSVAATGDGASGQEDEQCGEEVLSEECLQGGMLLLARTGWLNCPAYMLEAGPERGASQCSRMLSAAADKQTPKC